MLGYRHRFPEQITLEGCPMVLVDDPFIACVWKGDTILGWEGESDLAVYLDVPNGSWNLLRFCPGPGRGEYRVLARFAALLIPTADIPATMVRWLVEHDSRRGFTTEAIHLHNERLEAERQKALDEWAVEELSPRVQHSILREL